MNRPPSPLFEPMRRFYLENPASIRAARPIKEGATSLVEFEGDDRPYTLIRENGLSVLRPGTPGDPDMYFRFTSGAVEILTSKATTSISEYAIQIFDLILSDDPRRAVDYKLFSDFSTLWKKGYVEMLLLGGPSILLYGARHGVRGVGGLRKLISSVMTGSSGAVIEELRSQKRERTARGKDAPKR